MSLPSVCAADVRCQPIRWLWLRRLPRGMITLVAGRPGEGKSLFGCYLAARVSHTASVLYASREDPLAQVIRPRLEAAGASLERVHLLSLDLPHHIDALHHEIRRRHAKLLVIDPLAAHLSVSIQNDQQVRRALTPLADIAEHTHCAVLVISHTTKHPRRDAHPLDAIAGSGGGLRAAARMAYIFAQHPTIADQRVLATCKTNISPQPASLRFHLTTTQLRLGAHHAAVAVLVEAGQCQLTASQLLTAPTPTPRHPHQHSLAEQWLISELRAGPRPAHQLRQKARHHGITTPALQHAAHQLGVTNPHHPADTWALPQALLQHLDQQLDQELGELLHPDQQDQ